MASKSGVPAGGVEAANVASQPNLNHPPQHEATSYPHPSAYQHATQYPYPPPPAPPQQCQQKPIPRYQPDQVSAVPFHAQPDDMSKSTTMAVILCIPVLGLFGLHHFYLNRTFFGYIYAFTFGICGIGWICDWFRIKSLVRTCNQDTREAQISGHKLYSNKFPMPLTRISLCDAYLMWLPPAGIFGFYQYYLGRSRYGIWHSFTFGRCALGWLLDFWRLPAMVRKANEQIAMMKNGVRVPEDRYSYCDTFTLAFPLGIFGLHHFYLGNTKRGYLFLCTLGVFGLGWLADLFQMSMLVSEANKNLELRQRLAQALANESANSATTSTVVVVSHDNQAYQGGAGGPPNGVGNGVAASHEPPPAYSMQAAAGESVVHGTYGTGGETVAGSSGFQEVPSYVVENNPPPGEKGAFK